MKFNDNYLLGLNDSNNRFPDVSISTQNEQRIFWVHFGGAVHIKNNWFFQNLGLWCSPFVEMIEIDNMLFWLAHNSYRPWFLFLSFISKYHIFGALIFLMNIWFRDLFTLEMLIIFLIYTFFLKCFFFDSNLWCCKNGIMGKMRRFTSIN